MEQVESFAGTGGMIGSEGKANKPNQRSAYKQCASWILSKNSFQALQARNLLELTFLCILRIKKSSFSQKNSPGEGRLEIGGHEFFLTAKIYVIIIILTKNIQTRIFYQIQKF